MGRIARASHLYLNRYHILAKHHLHHRFHLYRNLHPQDAGTQVQKCCSHHLGLRLQHDDRRLTLRLHLYIVESADRQPLLDP